MQQRSGGHRPQMPWRSGPSTVATIVGVLSVLSACAPSGTPPPEPQSLSQSQSRSRSALICPTSSLIARRPVDDNRACPRFSGSVTFSGAFLSTRPSPQGRLFDYCKYELSQGAARVLATTALRDELASLLRAEPKGTQLLPDRTPVVRVEQDCAVVVPNQDGEALPTTEEALADLAEVTIENAGLRSASRDATLQRGDPTPVRAALIDTAEVPFDSLAAQDLSPHGRAVGLTLLASACANEDPSGAKSALFDSGGACPLELRNYLGLPVVNASTNERARGQGGYLGTRGDIALALRRALDDAPASERSQLLINLSVGWHGEHNEQFIDELPPPARTPGLGFGPTPPGGPPDTGPLASASVYWLLQEANCHGALVLAAAGNAQFEDREGPLYPAGWEAVPALAPESDDCRHMVRAGSRLGPAGRRGGALVYAVSAVDHAGDLLANTRLPAPGTGLGGTARRAALGAFVVAHDPRSKTGFTPPLTGTSLATAIVSGVAGSVWAREGKLSSHEVMAIIDHALEPAPGPGPVDLCLGGSCAGEYGIVRRCQVLGQSCPPPAFPDALALDALSPPTPVDPSLECAGQADCPLTESCDKPDGCEATLPSIYPLLEPWAGPQPPGGVCSLCSVRDHMLDKLWENRLPISSGLPSNVKAAKPWAVRLYAPDRTFLTLYTGAAWSISNQTLWFVKTGALDRVSAEVNVELQVDDPERGLSKIYQLELVPLIKQ